MKTHEKSFNYGARIFRKNCFETNKLNFLAIIFYRRSNICDCNETDFHRNSSTPWMKCHSWISFPKRAAFQRENENRFDWKFSFCWKLQSVRKQQNCAIQSVAKENKNAKLAAFSQDAPNIHQTTSARFSILIGKLQFSNSLKDCREVFIFSKAWRVSMWRNFTVKRPANFRFSWKFSDSRAKRFPPAKTYGTTSSRVYNSDEYYLRSLCFAKDFPIIICFLSSFEGVKGRL